MSALSGLPPVLAAGFMAQDDLLAWIVAFSLIPWLMVSQVGLQPGVLAVAGDLAEQGWKSHGASLAVVALKTSLGQYVGLVAAAGIALRAVDLIWGLPAALEQMVQHPRVVIVLVGVGLMQAVGSVGNAFLIAVGAASRMAMLTSVGAGAFLVGALLQIWLEEESSPLIFSMILLTGMSVPAIGFLYAVVRMRRASNNSSLVPSSAAPSYLRGQLYGFMAAQAVWVIPSLLVSRLDNVLVAEFEPDALRLYSIALAMLMLVAGALGALASPYVTYMTRLLHGHVGQRFGQLGSWGLIEAPLRALARRSILLSVAGFVIGVSILLAWKRWNALPSDSSITLALPLLAAGLSIRTLTVPLATLAVAARRQTSLFPSAISEAVANGVLSGLLGYRLGAVGVALGTLFGSIVAIALHGYAALHLLQDLPVRRLWWIRTVLVPSAFLLVGGVFMSWAITYEV